MGERTLDAHSQARPEKKRRRRKGTWVGILLLIVLLALVALTVQRVHYWKDLPPEEMTCLPTAPFSAGQHSKAEDTVRAYAREMGVPYESYPQSLIELLERNPETEDFVLGYPFREEGEIDLSAYEGGDTVPLFLQWDPQWGYEKYGSDVIGITGCGPACLAMVGYYLTEDPNMNPADIADFAWKKGYYESGYGSSWTLISEGGAELGFTVRELPLVKKKLVKSLEEGKPVILAMGPGDFTTTGHYIVLTGVEDGLFRINDPNSRANSERLWSYEELEGQIRNIWSITK